MQSYLSWFDFVTVIMAGVGVWVGRRRGMSMELLDLILWGAIVMAAGLLTPAFGRWITDVMLLSPATSSILAYLLIAVALVFASFLVRRWVGVKLVSSDAFGSLEYYLGMVAGGIRFLCILLAVMALLHAPYTSEEELQRKLRTQRDDLGSVYFPPFGQIQRQIFRDSLTGRTVEKQLGFLLIQPKGGKAGSSNIYRQREQLIDEVIGPK